MPFPKCAGYSSIFKIYRFHSLPAKMCRFRVNGRPIRRIFHRFQNVPASRERSLSKHSMDRFIQNLELLKSLASRGNNHMIKLQHSYLFGQRNNFCIDNWELPFHLRLWFGSPLHILVVNLGIGKSIDRLIDRLID